MKFAKELEADLVPEWRAKYLDYKGGKRKVKAIQKALVKAKHSPNVGIPSTPRNLFSRPKNSTIFPSYPDTPKTPKTPGYRRHRRSDSGNGPGNGKKKVQAVSSAVEPSLQPVIETPDSQALGSTGSSGLKPASSPSIHVDGERLSGRSPTSDVSETLSEPQPLSLPDPALTHPLPHRGPSLVPAGHDADRPDQSIQSRRNPPNADTSPASLSLQKYSIQQAAGDGDGDGERRDRPLIRRLWSDMVHPGHRQASGGHRGLHLNLPSAARTGKSAAREIDEREGEFFHWIEGQLDMVETFYREKEEEAVERLEVLKAQLGRMRDLRTREVEKARHKKQKAVDQARQVEEVEQQTHELDGNGLPGPDGGWADAAGRSVSDAAARMQSHEDPTSQQRPWYAPIEHKLGFGTYRFGRNTEALTRMEPSGYDYKDPDRESTGSTAPDSDGSSASERRHSNNSDHSDPTLRNSNGETSRPTSSPTLRGQSPTNTDAGATDEQAKARAKAKADRRDYTRKAKKDQKVPYDRAKRQLKLALQEYYRGLELLKAYALLNRTAFRKINKKYDKVVDARPTLEFFSQRVNDSAYFVQSGVLDQAMVAVEDLYARYFARGNRKVAVNKLRARSSREDAGPTFRIGVFLSAGTVLSVQGLVYASETLYGAGTDPTIRLQTNYLLQLYGGFFLTLLLFLGFVVACSIWVRSKINYVFIFEFDTRHNLGWRQLAELPCFLYLLMGLFLFLNFNPYTHEEWYIYWPTLLIAFSIFTVFIPLPIFYHKSRWWWIESNFRLFCAGLFPVEFRDFFLGDMYCSLTYALGNVEVFFCLYGSDWMSPTMCSSANSRVLGFMTTVPGILRALQCVRRYADSKHAFPHLVNCGKYVCTILFYMTLSMYRITKHEHEYIAFIFFATLNSMYVIFWDIFMDWSLGDPSAPHKGLRKELGFKAPWFYYTAAVIDPILRFNWIFYAIFGSELQHSALLSFFVALSEIFRRIMWTLIRVENEHCTNVGRFRASRDISLPYSLPASLQRRHSAISAAGSQVPAPVQHPARVSSKKGSPIVPPSPGASTAIDVEAAAASRVRSRGSQGAGSTPRFGPSTPLQRGLSRVGEAISNAHAQDFERKRRPDPVRGSSYRHSWTAGMDREEEDREDFTRRTNDDSEDEDYEADSGSDDDADDHAVRQMAADEAALTALEEEEEQEREREEQGSTSPHGLGRRRLSNVIAPNLTKRNSRQQ